MNATQPAEAVDIQGLLWSGFGSLPEAAFLLVRIDNPPAARVWLHTAGVTTIADLANPQATVLQIALSANGLRRLGVPDRIRDAFAPEFLDGMAGDAARSRRLGDVGASAPENWRWGYPSEPDALLLLYAQAGGLETFKRDIGAAVRQAGFTVVHELPTSDMGSKEPFGFKDGVSQPRIDWEGRRTPNSSDDLEYGNLISVGEFVLGYRNEYGLYTERPVLAESGALPDAEDRHGSRDLGRNGSYLVLRELHQDVRGFWRFVAEQAGISGAEALAEAMVGRHRSGEPLVARHHLPIRGVGPGQADIEANQFIYDADRAGVGCPVGAHVRRANPRTGDLPGGRQGLVARLLRTLGVPRPDLRSDLIASSRFHRIVRRGREFGSWVDPRTAMQPDCPEPASGLHFICLNANISRQFEFIQNAWLNSAKFNGLGDESDPLTGNRMPLQSGQPTDRFSLPQANGVARRLQSIPPFVTVRGGGYFFLPGVRALRFLTQ